MITRKAIDYLKQWKERSDRKPLVLRGARQVGKTTLVETFAKEYDVFLHLNLERPADRELFERYHEVSELLRAIFVHKNKIDHGTVLLFIDEIQYSKRAVAILRYFYEDLPRIHVITAGSLLETVIDVRKISFPVGRVEYLPIRPCTFLEFLSGTGNDFDVNVIQSFEADFVHDRLMKHFHEYTLVGGMPAIVSKYAENHDVLVLKRLYNSLLQAYKDDVEKYTRNATTIRAIRTILDVGWMQAGSTITFEKFGASDFSSKEMSPAFQTIQKAMLLELVYPSSSVQMPVLQNLRRQPKLLWLDTGLVNYFSGIQKEVFSVADIQDVWRGRIAEHIVGQELLALDDSILNKRQYWRRDKQGSEAEVDFIYKYNSMAIPVEVKSGHNSRLTSLHLFMDECPHDFAVRVWSQPLSLDEVTSPRTGKRFRLLSLPFYYVGILERILDKYFKLQTSNFKNEHHPSNLRRSPH
ncbi:MAG: AAA family ATPase [Dysgonamonadaceae bacterium]|jgi:predicted AAA+ superfamily ATPase|nr:AAA family ATPase [Dysgonamonadaceae bacterium]